MTNVFESMKDLFTPQAADEQQNPLHVGEVMHAWVLLTLIEEGLTVYQQSLNTTKDVELIHALRRRTTGFYRYCRAVTFFFKERRYIPATCV